VDDMKEIRAAFDDLEVSKFIHRKSFMQLIQMMISKTLKTKSPIVIKKRMMKKKRKNWKTMKRIRKTIAVLKLRGKEERLKGLVGRIWLIVQLKGYELMNEEKS
jgi:uncharacterized protein with ParB-like and HNH nuclease domain